MLKLCFSSLGCPEMDHLEMAKLAQAHRLWGVELRGKSADAHISPDTPKEKQREILKIYQDHGLNIAGITGYVQFARTDLTQQNTEDIARFAELCANMNAGYVRAYLGDVPDADENRIAAGIFEACRAAQDYPIRILLEMHDALKTGTQAGELIQAAGSCANLGVIFDTVTPFRQGETPQQAWNLLQDRVGALHIRAVGDDGKKRNHQVLPGDSRYPFDEMLRVLADAAFDGPWVLLWERVFDPTLCAMPEAIEAYRAAIEKHLR